MEVKTMKKTGNVWELGCSVVLAIVFGILGGIVWFLLGPNTHSFWWVVILIIGFVSWIVARRVVDRTTSAIGNFFNITW